MQKTIALFGEAEMGEYRTAYFFQTLPQLLENLGNPPLESQGLHYAIQTLLFNYNLIYFRVEEEGFSIQDYLLGVQFLEQTQLVNEISAVCLPGVGDGEIIGRVEPVCSLYDSILITSEKDLYDYLTYTTSTSTKKNDDFII